MINKKTIKVVLVDDHAIFRDGIELLIELNPLYELVANLSSARGLFEWLKSNAADVFILDINLPGTSGIEVARQLFKELGKPKILFLTSNTAKSYIENALKTGAKGFLTKESSKSELFDALDHVHRNQFYFGKNIEQSLYENYANTLHLVDDKNELTEREVEVVRAFANGLSYKEVEEELNISKKTIETHKKNIFQKLGIKNQADLIKYAIRQNIIEL